MNATQTNSSVQNLLAEMGERAAVSEGERVTVRQLRKILFDVADQDLTVKELRAALFQMDQEDYATESIRAGTH